MRNKTIMIAHIGMTGPLGGPGRTPGAMERIMKMTLQPQDNEKVRANRRNLQRDNEKVRANRRRLQRDDEIGKIELAAGGKWLYFSTLTKFQPFLLRNRNPIEDQE